MDQFQIYPEIQAKKHLENFFDLVEQTQDDFISHYDEMAKKIVLELDKVVAKKKNDGANNSNFQMSDLFK